MDGMLFDAQMRPDAKDDKCETFRIKSEQILDQLNGDMARLFSQEASNTATAHTTLCALSASLAARRLAPETRSATPPWILWSPLTPAAPSMRS